MATIGFDDEYKIWRYQYDLSDDEAQVLSRDGIESEALRLLECLKSCREGETDETRGKKHFAFVMLDIGGIIVKKARSLSLKSAVCG